jgi:ribosomal protein S1
MEGFEAQREAWENEYAAAQARWEAHKAQVAKALDADSAGAPSSDGASDASSSYSSGSQAGGTLASDEALAALREKLTNN